MGEIPDAEKGAINKERTASWSALTGQVISLTTLQAKLLQPELSKSRFFTR